MQRQMETAIITCAQIAEREAARLRFLAEKCEGVEGREDEKIRWLANALTADTIARNIREMLPPPKTHAIRETPAERSWRLSMVFTRLNQRLRREGRRDAESVRLERCAMTAALVASFQSAGMSAELIEKEIADL